MTDVFQSLLDDLAEQVKSRKATVTALETKEFALRETIKELEGRIGDHTKNLQVKNEIDKLVAQLEAFPRS